MRYSLDPLRGGSEKDEGFPHRARETTVARYKRLQLVVIGWNAKRKDIGFFGHITEQASGSCQQAMRHQDARSLLQRPFERLG
jgi:hypothetical protein